MSATARAITESHVPSDAMRADALESDPEAVSAADEVEATTPITSNAVTAGSIPRTVKESTPNAPPPKPPPPAGASPSVPPGGVPVPSPAASSGRAGSSPEKLMFTRLSAPVAPETPLTPATVSTSAASRVPRPGSVVSRDWLSVVSPSASVASAS